MSTPGPADALRPLFLTQAIRHRWKLIVAGGVIALLAGLAYTFSGGHQYTATAQVLVNPIVGNPYSAQSTTNSSSVVVAMQTEAGVVGSAVDTAAVNRQLGLELDAYPAGLSTVVPDNTQIVNVSYSARHPNRARSVAQAYATAYLARRAALAHSSQASQLAQLNAVAQRTQAALNAAAKAAGGTSPDPGAAVQVQVYSSQLTSVQAQIGATQALNTNPGTLLTPPSVAAGTSSTKQAVLVFAVVIIGLALGLVVAAWRERRSDLVYADDTAGAGQVPVLGRFAADESVDRGDDQLRLIRLGLQLALEPPAVVAVTPLSPAESVLSLGSGVAGSLHSAGHTTVLVDARVDPDSEPLIDGRGLSDVITADGGVLPLRELDGVPVLGPGTAPVRVRDRYSGPPLQRLLARLRADFDYVILLTGPGNDPIGVAVAAAADAVLVVVTERSSHYGDIAQLATLLEHGGSRALGTLLLRSRRGRAARRRSPAASSSAAPSGPSGPSAPSAGIDADGGPASPAARDDADRPAQSAGRRRGAGALTRARERR